MRTWGLVTVLTLLLAAGNRVVASITVFDFENARQYAPLPLDLTVDNVTAHFAAAGQGYSIQNTGQVIGVLPVGFSGLGLVPRSVYASDLTISFPSQTISSFKILFAPQELALDSTATLRGTATKGGVMAKSITASASSPGTWPSGTLAIDAPQGFDSVVIHYDKAPPGASENWGPIFVADNMTVTLDGLGAADLNSDGTVDAADAGIMFANWGLTGPADLTHDGIIDAADAGELFAAWTGDATPVSLPEPNANLLSLAIWTFGHLNFWNGHTKKPRKTSRTIPHGSRQVH